MIQPKYEIGQQVWVIEIRNVQENIICPDCLGTKFWPITTPGGDKFDLECATCRYGYDVRGFIAVPKVLATAIQATISSIRIDTASDHPVEYTMRETDIAYGRLWYETDVFSTENDAQPRMKEKQLELQKEQDRREAIRIAENKKRCRKPTYEQRRIRELEKQIKKLTNNQRQDQ